MPANPLPVLRIDPLPPRGVAFSQSPLSNLSVPQWTRLVAGMLEFAFRGRAVCFITPDEKTAWYDLDFRKLYPDCESRQIQSYAYLCAFDPAGEPAPLRALAASQDFYLGPVWLAALERADRQRWDALLTAKLSAGATAPPQTTEEMIYCNPDGDWIYWINPARPVALILAELKRAAQAAGWETQANIVKETG